MRAIDAATSGPELVPCEDPEGLEVLLARLLDDVVRQHGTGGLLVELDRLEVVSDELLVERGWRDALAVADAGPVARGVRRQRFVNQRDGALDEIGRAHV